MRPPLAAALMSLVLLAGCDAGSQPILEPGPQLLAQLVSGRVAAGDIPDHGLAIDGDTLYIVQEGARNAQWGELRSEYFSHSDVHIVVTTLGALREISAARNGAQVPYLSVRGPVQVSGSRWHLYLGGDYAVAEPEFMKLCCCTGEAIFDLTPDRVDFLEWGSVICA